MQLLRPLAWPFLGVAVLPAGPTFRSTLLPGPGGALVSQGGGSYVLRATLLQGSVFNFRTDSWSLVPCPSLGPGHITLPGCTSAGPSSGGLVAGEGPWGLPLRLAFISVLLGRDQG